MLAHRRTGALALGTLIAAAAATTSAQDLVLGPELPMDSQVDVPDRGPSVERLFAIDTGYLAVGGGEAIRLRPDGTSLDPGPFSFGSRASDIACGPTQCLIATNSPMTTQRVQPDGTLVDATPVPIGDGGINIRVAWAGDRYFVAWNATVSGDSDLYFIHLRTDGTQVQAAPVHIALPDSQFLRSVSCDASACLLAYREQGAIAQTRAMRIAHDGTVLDPLGIPVPSGTATDIRVMSQGSFHLLYWFSASYVRGARIGADGALLDHSAFAISLSSSSMLYQGACSASGCLLGIRSGSYLYLYRIDGTGGAIRAASIGSEIDTFGIACGAAGCRIAYSESGSTNVMSTVELTPTGTVVGTPIQPVLRANAQSGPHIIAGDSDFLASWVDDRATPNEIRVVRLSSGGALAADSTMVTTDDRRASGGTIGAYGGGAYFVGWQENQQLFVRRVLADGTLPDSNPIRVSPTFRNVSNSQVAFDSTNFMFTWKQDGTLVGLRMSPIGATLEAEPFLVHSSNVTSPVLAFGETSYMTIWSEIRGTRMEEIYGLGIATDGTPEQTLSFPVASADRSQTNPAIAYGGGHYLAVWVDDRYFDTIGHNLIYAARVLQDGTVLDPAGIQVRAGDVVRVQRPTVAWNGTEFVVAWDETVEVEDPPGVVREINYVALARVAADGTVLDPVPVKTTPLERSSYLGVPSLASTPTGTTMLVYSRFDDTPTVRANRVFARTVMSGSSGTSCGSPGDCASGVCVDGVCCDRACDGACEACTVAGGAPVDGVCAPRAAGTVCRASSGAVCDVDEVCDGASAACPADAPDPSCDSPDGGAGVDAGGMGRQDGGMGRQDGGASGADAGVTGGDGGSEVPPGDDGGCSASGGPRAGAPWYGLGLLLGLVVFRRTRRRQPR